MVSRGAQLATASKAKRIVKVEPASFMISLPHRAWAVLKTLAEPIEFRFLPAGKEDERRHPQTIPLAQQSGESQMHIPPLAPVRGLAKPKFLAQRGCLMSGYEGLQSRGRCSPEN